MLSYKKIIYEGEEIRLDRYLKRVLTNLPQSVIEKSFRNNYIKVDNKPVKTGFKLQGGHEISINSMLYEKFDNPPSEKFFSIKTILLAKKVFETYLLYDHPEFFAINKPSKLATQGGSKITISLDHALAYLNSFGENYKLVHRLDKDTSGIILVAKGYDAAAKLTKAFADKLIIKNYLAIVEGTLLKNHGEISSIIHKNNQHADEGKVGITKYKLIKKLGINCSLVEFMPLTGRTHQLRAHAKELGCPIIGDIKYGNEVLKNNKNNLLLHATKITLPKTIFGEEIIIEAMPPAYFNKIIEDKLAASSN